jgi:hypothetical protein
MSTSIQIPYGYQGRYELLGGKAQQNILHANLSTYKKYIFYNLKTFSNQVWGMTVKQGLAFVCGLWKQRKSD